MFTRKSLIVVLTVAALFAFLAPQVVGAAPTFQSPPPTPVVATLNVTGVSSGLAAVNREFTTDVVFTIEVTGSGLNGADIYIGYDPALVDPVDADAVTAGLQPAEPQNGFFGVNPTVFATNEVLTACPSGASACVHLVLADMTPQTSKTGAVARLHWRGKAVGTANFSVLNPWMVGGGTPASPYTAFSNSDGVVIPFTAVSALPIPIVVEPMGNIVGVAVRQGVPPLGGPGTLGCTDIRATGTISTVLGTTFFDLTYPPNTPPAVQQPGGFWLQARDGTYTVRASYPGYLPSEVAGVVAVDNTVVNVGNTRLVGGDVNSDNAINMLDIASIIAKFGQTGVAVRSDQFDCVDPDEPTDINDDGKVNIGDISIAAGNFMRIGPTAWAP